MTLFVEVVFPLPIDGSFHYRVPDAIRAEIGVGQRVLTPFGRRMMAGFVVAVSQDPPAGGFELKDICEVLDDIPFFSNPFLSFTRNLSAFFHVSWGAILKAALPPTLAFKDKKKVLLTSLGRELLDKGGLSKKEQELASWIRSGSYAPHFLAKKMGKKNISGLLSRMERKGLLLVHVVPRRPGKKKCSAGVKPIRQLEFDFTEESKPAATALIERKIKAGESGSFYLFGPRAALEAAYARLARSAFGVKAKVLFLAPEISASGVFIRMMNAGFEESVAVLHSRLAGRKREEEWRKLVEGRAEAVIGARSALLAPVPDLRLIIVDQEPDESYVQQEGQLYDTRIGAGLRAADEGAVAVYGSSWPSIEAFHEARASKTLIVLEKETRKFKTSIVDDRREKAALSAVLREKIRERLAKNDPVILFVNRRGYASWTFCPNCGYSPRCRRCDIALSFHKKNGAWACHYCGFTLPASPECPQCGRALFQKRATGIEAVEEELKKAFPGVSTANFDADVAGGEENRGKILEDFRRGRITVLLGTRLLAYRVDGPKVPFVGILSPEILLGLSDYRAGQRLSRSIVQMMSFVGDDEKAEVAIQTSCPSHFSIRTAAAGDYAAFFDAEIESRRLLNYPPFSRLAEVLFRGGNVRSLARTSRDFASRLKSYEREIETLGPALASVSRVRGLYQIQIILKARDKGILDKALSDALKKAGVKPFVRFS